MFGLKRMVFRIGTKQSLTVTFVIRVKWETGNVLFAT